MQSTIKKSGKKGNSLVKKKEFTSFYARVFSRHPSHNSLRKSVLLPFRAVVRFGSTTPSDIRVQCNSIEAVRNSADKLRMKKKFTEANVTTAEWRAGETNTAADILKWTKDNKYYPVVAKHRFGSRGEGNYLINSEAELKEWFKGKTLSNYIFEKFYNYTREYRLHVNDKECFYACRKMIKKDTPEKDRWYRNNDNCTWFLETNPDFDRPSNWKNLENECIKALKAVGLDIGACDIRIQSSDKAEPKFVIIEINSAPSLQKVGLEKYGKEIPRLLKEKFTKIY